MCIKMQDDREKDMTIEGRLNGLTKILISLNRRLQQSGNIKQLEEEGRAQSMVWKKKGIKHYKGWGISPCIQ